MTALSPNDGEMCMTAWFVEWPYCGTRLLKTELWWWSNVWHFRILVVTLQVNHVAQHHGDGLAGRTCNKLHQLSTHESEKLKLRAWHKWQRAGCAVCLNLRCSCVTTNRTPRPHRAELCPTHDHTHVSVPHRKQSGKHCTPKRKENGKMENVENEKKNNKC